MSKIESMEILEKKEDYNRFQLILNKPDGTFETLFYQKQNEKFNRDGYAVVRAYSKDKKYANQTWYGVIDKNFQTIIPFRLWDRIDLHLGNQVIVQESFYRKDSLYPFTRTYHYYIYDGKIALANVFGKSKKIDEDLLLVEDSYDSVQHIFLYSLYNIALQKVVSNSFYKIGDAIEKDSRKIFPASRKLMNHNVYLHSVEVFCYIDEKGNIVSNVYNPIDDCYEEITREMFDSYIENLENRNPVHRSSEEVFLELERSIRKERKK